MVTFLNSKNRRLLNLAISYYTTTLALLSVSVPCFSSYRVGGEQTDLRREFHFHRPLSQGAGDPAAGGQGRVEDCLPTALSRYPTRSGRYSTLLPAECGAHAVWNVSTTRLLYRLGGH